MARLQILELPEGADDSRPPFVLVVDECAPQRVVLGMGGAQMRDHWQEIADRIGARAVIVMPDTVEIPANEATLPDPRELVAEAELRVERDGGRRCSVCGVTRDLWADLPGTPTCAVIKERGYY